MTDKVGELRLSSQWDEMHHRHRVVIDHADPVARIHSLTAYEIMAGQWPSARIDVPDNVLTIDADNRRVVYVIDRGSWDAATDSFLMRWPD